MRTHRHFWALAAALLAACGDYGAPDEVVYGTAVYTQPSSGFDPVVLGTYFLDTTIVTKDDSQTPPTQTSTMPTNVQNAIASNMTAYGWRRVNTAAEAKAQNGVVLTMAVVKGTAAVYYPGYWCDYWYYYSCYYSWYYAGSYGFGSAILEMALAANYNPGGTTPPPGPTSPLWGSMMYGVATTQSYDTQRLVEAVNRAFAQSPYLKR
jgi:hypothetical protein